MNGLLIVDKPQGITSHDVVRKVRRLFKTRKVGHAGTLDPLATGVLLVALGEGTRVLQFLVEGAKTYQATLKLGEVTDTQDAEGQIIENRPLVGIDEPLVRSACAEFSGVISQLPPMFSAVKKNGIPLHRLARQGVEVERESRDVTIHRLDVVGVRLPWVDLEVDCSKGTYIRTLCHDIGQSLGCGAHVTALRRTRSGSFTEKQSLSLEEIAARLDAGDEAGLLSLEEALRELPAVEVVDSAAARLQNGIPPELDGICGDMNYRSGDTVVLLHCGRLQAVACFAPEREKEKRGDFELLRVFKGPQAA